MSTRVKCVIIITSTVRRLQLIDDNSECKLLLKLGWFVTLMMTRRHHWARPSLCYYNAWHLSTVDAAALLIVCGGRGGDVVVMIGVVLVSIAAAARHGSASRLHVAATNCTAIYVS